MSAYIDEICRILKVSLQPNEKRALVEHMDGWQRKTAAKAELPEQPNKAHYAQAQSADKPTTGQQPYFTPGKSISTLPETSGDIRTK